MKKISMTMLFLAAFSMAEECDLKLDGREITVLDTTLWWRSTRSFWYGAGMVVVNGEATFILEDGYNCQKQEYEKAFLDSNTYIQRDRWNGLQELIIGQNSLSIHGIGEVFRDEFLHWQKCGMLNLTYEQADSIVTPLVEAMSLRDSGYYETELFFINEYPYSGTGMPQQFIDWAKQDCIKASVASIEKKQNRITAPFLFEQGFVHIPNSLRGKNYFVFDMNGKVVQKGVAEETIRISIIPSILKLGERQLFLLK